MTYTIWDEASEMPREVWNRPMIVSPTLYRMLEERSADMRFYKTNDPIPEGRRGEGQ